MKKFLPALFLFFSLSSFSQIFQSFNITMLSLSNPNLLDTAVDNRHYSGCWGWYQAGKNREYGISGASNGTYFIDITAPTSPTVCDFVPGSRKSTYREMKTYQNYCYIICDDGHNKKFQIVDMQYLPDSVHTVYDDTTLFKRGHTLWIDKDKLYIGAMMDYSLNFAPMAVFSLATPTAPVLLRRLHQDIPPIGYVHDMYVRNDTIYASCGNQGLFILKYDDVNNKFVQLGSYTGYSTAGYNHSSFLTGDGKHLIFCDEVPEGLPIHFVNVENFGNIQPVKDWHPQPFTTPHNPYIRGKFAFVSCYQDGLYIYDVSNPNALNLVGFFDTHYQGGGNINQYNNAPYRGNWGAYPFLPSGVVIANDMQNGMFVLNASTAFSTTLNNYVGVQENSAGGPQLIVYPNPVSSFAALRCNTTGSARLEVKNILGEVVETRSFSGPLHDYLDVRNFAEGTYFISISEEQRTVSKKLIIHH